MSGKTPKQVITSARKTNAGRRGGWLQLATYPQSPFSGPARCCDVTDLCQAFSQRTGPGRLWISLSADSFARLGRREGSHEKAPINESKKTQTFSASNLNQKKNEPPPSNGQPPLNAFAELDAHDCAMPGHRPV